MSAGRRVKQVSIQACRCEWKMCDCKKGPEIKMFAGYDPFANPVPYVYIQKLFVHVKQVQGQQC